MNEPATTFPAGNDLKTFNSISAAQCCGYQRKSKQTIIETMKITLLLTTLASAAIGAAVLTGCNSGHDHASHDHGTGGTKTVAAQLCPVSGEKLGGMGDPYVLKYEGQEVKLCCENCKADFLKDPKKYLSKMAK